MRLYQRLAIVGTTLFELLTPVAYAAPPQPVQPETTVCLPLSEFEKLCLPKSKPHALVNPNPKTPQPNHPTRPTHPVTPRRPKVPQTSERCDQYFQNTDDMVGYTGVCVNDPATLQRNPDLITTPGPAGLCSPNTYCIGIMVKPQAPTVVEKTVEVKVPVPDKGAQDKIDKLTKLVEERLPIASDLTSGPTLRVYGSEQGTVGFNAGYQGQVSQRVRLGISGGYLHLFDSELKETVSTSGQTHDLPAGIQEVVGNTHTAQSYRGQDRGTIGIEANITLYDGPVLEIDATLGLEAAIYKTGEGSRDQRDAYLMQNGQRTTDTKTATTQVPVDKHVTADITSYVDVDFLFNAGKGFKVGPSFGLGVTFPNMSTDDVRVGGRYGVKATYEF